MLRKKKSTKCEPKFFIDLTLFQSRDCKWENEERDLYFFMEMFFIYFFLFWTQASNSGRDHSWRCLGVYQVLGIALVVATTKASKQFECSKLFLSISNLKVFLIFCGQVNLFLTYLSELQHLKEQTYIQIFRRLKLTEM